MKPTYPQISGVVRAILPVAVLIAGRRGVDLSFLSDPDVIAGLTAIACAVWSVQSKRTPTDEKADTPSANPPTSPAA